MSDLLRGITLPIVHLAAKAKLEAAAFEAAFSEPELPKCPHCDTTLKPEGMGAGRFTCPCCSRVFSVAPSKG